MKLIQIIEAVRTADEPDVVLSEFIQSTYEATADLANLDRDALERKADPKRICAEALPVLALTSFGAVA